MNRSFLMILFLCLSSLAVVHCIDARSELASNETHFIPMSIFSEIKCKDGEVFDKQRNICVKKRIKNESATHLAILMLLCEQSLAKFYVYRLYRDPRGQNARLKYTEDDPIHEIAPEYMCRPGLVYDVSRGICIEPSRNPKCPPGEEYDTAREICIKKSTFPK